MPALPEPPAPPPPPPAYPPLSVPLPPALPYSVAPGLDAGFTAEPPFVVLPGPPEAPPPDPPSSPPCLVKHHRRHLCIQYMVQMVSEHGITSWFSYSPVTVISGSVVFKISTCSNSNGVWCWRGNARLE